MEPVSGALVGAAQAAKAVDESKLLARLFGPVIDDMGQDLVHSRRRRNAARVAQKGADNLAERGVSPGTTTPNLRVSHRLLLEGSLTEDEVAQTYLGRMLAAAHIEGQSSDRAAYFVDLCTRLTSDQTRLHHSVYFALACAELKDPALFKQKVEFDSHNVLAPIADCSAVLGLTGDVAQTRLLDGLVEAALGLEREGLIKQWSIAPGVHWPNEKFDESVTVLAVTGSQQGLLLHLWAHGITETSAMRIADTLQYPFDPPAPRFGAWEIVDSHPES
jgi:hypothetical protein